MMAALRRFERFEAAHTPEASETLSKGSCVHQEATDRRHHDMTLTFRSGTIAHWRMMLSMGAEAIACHA